MRTTRLKQALVNLRLMMRNDPVDKCALYVYDGCSHVDGILCDFPDCSMNKNHLEAMNKWNEFKKSK